MAGVPPGSGAGGESRTLLPLRGREAEIAQLRVVLRRSAPGSVVLVGPAGVGKTRLAREALGLVRANGVVTRWVVATRLTSEMAYGGLATLLRSVQLEGTSGPAELLRRSAAALSELAGADRLVLAVDDAHLLDRASASLLQQLVADRVITVIATVRARETCPEGITALWKDDLALRLDVAGLSPESIHRLLADLLGDYVDPAAAAVIAARCAGNALMFRELVQAALDDGALSCELGLWRLTGPLRPPESLVELVEQRLSTLGSTAREVMELISYGEPLGRAELTAAAGPAAVDVVSGLERAGLVASEIDGRRLVLRPAHPVYGDVIRRLTPASRVASMASALAESIETAGARRTEDILRVGVLRLDGGGGSAPIMLAAGHTARWRYEFALAERLALAASEAQASFEAGLLAAQCRALQGDPATAERQLRALPALALDDEKRTQLAITLVDLLWLNLGRIEDARTAAAQAEHTIDDTDLRTEVTERAAALLLASDGPRPAADVADAILPTARGRSLTWIGVTGSFAYGRLGRIHDAITSADRAYAAADTLSSPYGWYPWFAIYTRCEALAQSGRYREATKAAEEEYGRGLRSGSTEARAFFLWHLARYAQDRGHLDLAIAQAREGMALFRQLGYLPHQHSVGSMLVTAYALTGQAEQARDTINHLDNLGIAGPQWSHCDHTIARGWTEVAQGNLPAARAQFGHAADHGEEYGDLTGAATALHGLARIGRPEQAAPRLTQLAAQHEGQIVAARAAHAHALAADNAETLIEISTQFNEMGAHLLAAEAAADAALRLTKAGSPQQAAAAQQRAAKYLSHCGDAKTPSLTSVDVRSQLTPGEHEAAMLAAAGHSNREIAETLQLSVRTVGNRLQRVYDKLGISSRNDLDDLLS